VDLPSFQKSLLVYKEGLFITEIIRTPCFFQECIVVARLVQKRKPMSSSLFFLSGLTNRQQCLQVSHFHSHRVCHAFSLSHYIYICNFCVKPLGKGNKTTYKQPMHLNRQTLVGNFYVLPNSHAEQEELLIDHFTSNLSWDWKKAQQKEQTSLTFSGIGGTWW
jgi:hypothetical protein